jgi:hypothetical protein
MRRAGIDDLVQKMKGGSSSIVAQVVEAMTTNETFFFRDKIPFDHFRDSIMPEMLRRAPTERASGSGAPPARPAGAVFACHVAEGNGCGSGRVARRNHRDGPVQRSAREIKVRRL